MESAVATTIVPSNGASRDRRLIEGVMAKLPIFRLVSPRNLAELASHARTITVRRGAAVCAHGDTLPGVMALAYGTVKLSVMRANGQERVVRFVNPSETFCEASALFGRPCLVNAGALCDSMLVVIPSAPLLRLVERDPIFARRTVEVLAERVQSLMEELGASAGQRGPQRLASYLHRLVRPGEAPGSWQASLPASKTLVAARLGFSKETMSRLLRRFAEQGLIDPARSKIRILDRDGLALVARNGNN
jgi:CRP/FNR family transcriptional regulator, dissimilatory nitrate respiration regulator